MTPFRDAWNRIRRLGTKVEDELYEFSEEEELEEEPRGRNTLIALLNAFLTLWKTNEATPVERVLGLLGFAGLLWWIVGDRGMGIKKAPLRIAATTFAIVWFVPGLIASAWTLAQNLGIENLRRWRTYPLLFTFTAGGLIAFRAVFGDISRSRLRPLPPPRNEAKG